MNYEEMQQKFELLKKIIQPIGKYKLAANLDSIEKMIKQDIPKTFEQNPPTDFQKLYAEFVGEYERFHDFILFDRLIGKNVVALGGGFKSGKSTFLNHFILSGDKILPTGIDPSTSVPAYIIHKKETLLFGINEFDAKFELQAEDIKLISHKFDDSNETNTEKLSLAHLLKSIFIAVPEQKFMNLAFMDTPGYSKENTEYYTIKTNEQNEFLHLNSSNYILWFVDADLGTIGKEDISFLRKLRKNIPLVIIVNKADKRRNDIPLIKDKIKSILDSKDIPYEDILAYSSKSTNEFDRDKILEYLNKWNKRIYESDFARHFKVLFTKCKDYYEKIGELEQKKLKLIKEVMAYTQDIKMKERLIILQNVSLANLKLIDTLELKLMKLQDDFFCELLLIAGKVGIQMPVPSEINLIQPKLKNPFTLIKEYKEKHGLTNDNYNTVDILEEAFLHLNSQFNKQLGGCEYIDVLTETLEQNLVLNKSVQFNQF